jgi:hypothetical protein
MVHLPVKESQLFVPECKNQGNGSQSTGEYWPDTHQ